MKKPLDPVIKRETLYLTLWVLAVSLLTQGVCLLAGWWSFPVLWGTLLGGSAAILNFLLMGLTVQKALGQDEKRSALTIRTSQGGRLIVLGLVLALAAILDVFNIWTTIIPLLVPRIAMALRPHIGPKDPVPVVYPTVEDDEDDEEEDDD